MFDFPTWSFLNIYCIVDLVWTERATVCFVEIGCLFVCLVLILGVIDVFESIWLYAWMWSCFVIFFLFKSYSALFPLLSTHGLTLEVGGGLFTLTNQYLLFSPSTSFAFILFVLFSFPRPVFESLPLYLGVRWGTEVSIWGMRCVAIPMYSGY